jgi:hypothetical protein
MQSTDGDAQVASEQQKISTNDRQPVLVELFTSEGCSSCPPADTALAFLENQQPVTKAEIITLAFHVDYWDRLGWKDRFSSPLYSRRQEIYSQAFKLDSNYTPQMVVDGRFEFVGSDTGKATREILRSTEQSKAAIDVVVDKDRATVKIGDAPSHTDATVYAAIAEDGISTRVERGENSGKTLEHVSVVRELRTLGVLSSDKSTFEAAVDVTPPPDAKAENLKIVIFVQENESRRIIGVAKAKWAGTQLKAER